MSEIRTVFSFETLWGQVSSSADHHERCSELCSLSWWTRGSTPMLRLGWSFEMTSLESSTSSDFPLVANQRMPWSSARWDGNESSSVHGLSTNPHALLCIRLGTFCTSPWREKNQSHQAQDQFRRCNEVKLQSGQDKQLAKQQEYKNESMFGAGTSRSFSFVNDDMCRRCCAHFLNLDFLFRV